MALEKLQKLLGMTVLKKDLASQQEVSLIVHRIIKVLDETDKILESQITATNKDISSLKNALQTTQGSLDDSIDQNVKYLESKLKEVKDNLTSLVENKEKQVIDSTHGGLKTLENKLEDKWYKEINREVYKLEKLVKEIPQFDSSILERKFGIVIDEVEKKIVPYVLKPEEVRDSLETLKDENRLDFSAIKGWKEELKDFFGKIGQPAQSHPILRHGHTVNSYDLSDHLDGITSTFNIPAVWQIISVHSTSFPFSFRQTVDFTWTPTTITFTSQIDPATTLAAGQTITILYAEN